MRLSHDQNSLTFRFSDFNFSPQKSEKMMVWLEGYDKTWTMLTDGFNTSYKNLPSGHYTLHMRMADNDAPQGELTYSVTILPPWWATWWAIVIYCLLAIVVAVLIGKQLITVNNLRNKVKVERELTEFKLLFFTNISHEFRTPLTIIRTAMQNIQGSSNIPSAMRQPIDNMRRSVDRMMRLVNQLMEFRKMQAGELQLRLETTDVVTFVRGVTDMFRDIADTRRMQLVFIPFAQHYTMPVDRDFVDKIVYNLLSNAFKYTPAGRTITVRLQHATENKAIRIVVEDEGMGVEPEKREKLFTRFTQSSYVHDSMGIGLHLTAALVRTHHGEIGYTPGKECGSIFTVTLPDGADGYAESEFMKVAKDTPLGATTENAPQQQTTARYGEISGEPMNDRTVLVVEDDGDIAAMMRQQLSPLFTVRVAGNGSEALEMVREQQPDLVVSDVMMPVMNGWQLTEQLRKDDTTADIPIILLTALETEQEQMKGMKLGADAYITKPFSMPMLITNIQRLITERDKLKRRYAREVATHAEATPVITDEQDAKLRKMLDLWLYDHISDTQLNVEEFAESMGYGRTTFYKKMKALTGATPNEYIKKLRMQRAAELLKDDTLTVAEVASGVGIADAFYFSRLFKAHFGVSPTSYRKGNAQ